MMRGLRKWRDERRWARDYETGYQHGAAWLLRGGAVVELLAQRQRPELFCEFDRDRALALTSTQTVEVMVGVVINDPAVCAVASFVAESTSATGACSDTSSACPAASGRVSTLTHSSTSAGSVDLRLLALVRLRWLTSSRRSRSASRVATALDSKAWPGKISRDKAHRRLNSPAGIRRITC